MYFNKFKKIDYAIVRNFKILIHFNVFPFVKKFFYFCFTYLIFNFLISNLIFLWCLLPTTVFDAVQSPPLSSPPCKFGKILVVDNFVEKNYFENFRIRNYFKKDFLNFSFHYVRYCNHLVTFLEKISHQFALIFQALNEVSQSNIFLVFFC